MHFLPSLPWVCGEWNTLSIFLGLGKDACLLHVQYHYMMSKETTLLPASVMLQ